MVELGEGLGVDESLVVLRRELKRLRDLMELRSVGVEVALDSARLIRERVAGGDVSVRDLNRSLEMMTKTAVIADDELRKGREAEVEAGAPERDILLIILDSTIPDVRKRVMLREMADDLGDSGGQVLFDALRSVSSEERARELLEIEA